MNKTHFVSLRMLVNAGMRFPACYAGAKLLDLEKSRLPMVSDPSKVTCKNCRLQLGLLRRGGR